MRLAIIWDTRFVRLNAMHEIVVPEGRVDGANIFARDPLLGHFTFLDCGQARNDLIFVALHLASGRSRTEKHDTAMALLRNELAALEGTNNAVPDGEVDILLGGDLNASWFDRHREDLFFDFNRDGWKVLARRNTPYPPTRVNGSQIDYLIATHEDGSFEGLVDDEIDDDEAIVHLGLAADGRFRYRDVYSDHFPVTTCINVVADRD